MKTPEDTIWPPYEVFYIHSIRHLVRGDDNAPIEGPDHSTITEIAVQLVADPAAFGSIRRYTAQDLLWFGQWTAPDGTWYTGGSKRTAAYAKAAALLKEKLGVGE